MTALARLFRTTTFRLSLTYLALYGTAAAIAIGYIYWNTNFLLTRQLDETIQAEARGLAEQYQSGGLTSLVNTVADRTLTPGNSLYLVTDASGRRLAGNLVSVSRDLWDTVGRVEFAYTRSAQNGPEKRQALAFNFRLPGSFRLIVGRDINDRREFQAVIRAALFWGLGVMIFVGLAGGWLVSRKLLARIEAVAETGRTIMSGDLTRRVPLRGSGDELDRLSENLNVMLDRIEQLMTGLREVSDNIAHDLKTPLNRLRNRVEAALREDAGEGAYRDALERTIDEADELIKTFNALLSIARLEAGSAGESMERIDIGGLVRDVGELYEPVAEEEGFGLSVTAGEGLYASGDRQLLGQALANLIDNALKYAKQEEGGQERPSIGLAAECQDAQIEVSVTDNGGGIPESEHAHVLERFVRLEESRSRPGSGLGLSLVAAVAKLHGGRVRLEDNEPGLRVVLSIPQGQQ